MCAEGHPSIPVADDRISAWRAWSLMIVYFQYGSTHHHPLALGGGIYTCYDVWRAIRGAPQSENEAVFVPDAVFFWFSVRRTAFCFGSKTANVLLHSSEQRWLWANKCSSFKICRRSRRVPRRRSAWSVKRELRQTYRTRKSVSSPWIVVIDWRTYDLNGWTRVLIASQMSDISVTTLCESRTLIEK